MDLPYDFHSNRYFSYFDQFDATPNDTSKLALAEYSFVSNILLVIERAKFCANSTNYSYPSFARLFAASPTRIIFWSKHHHTNLDKGFYSKVRRQIIPSGMGSSIIGACCYLINPPLGALIIICKYNRTQSFPNPNDIKYICISYYCAGFSLYISC
jgi:hypothetical protein